RPRLEPLARLLAALTHALATEREPSPVFLEQVPLEPEIDELTRHRDAVPVHDVELGLAEGRRDLVLHDLHARAVADDLVSFLHLAEAADVEPHRAIELERGAARGRLG